ncbi:MAG TPA: GGDEF domain-containing protein, partial [Burkholderiaceae bacterium]|nr:GGDEF domain-containing protein [Burkholderiaceae bacterium]
MTAAGAAQADLFANERAALAQAREAYADATYGADQRHALGQLIVHYERLMRESARLIARSDRAERDMNLLNRRLQDMAAQLAHRASHDPLTGALN